MPEQLPKSNFAPDRQRKSVAMLVLQTQEVVQQHDLPSLEEKRPMNEE